MNRPDARCLYVFLQLPRNNRFVDLLLFATGKRKLRIVGTNNSNPWAWIHSQVGDSATIFYYSAYQLKSKSNTTESNIIPIFIDPIPESIHELVKHVDETRIMSNHECRRNLLRIFNPTMIRLTTRQIL